VGINLFRRQFKLSRFFLVAYVLNDSFLLINHTRDCASGVSLFLLLLLLLLLLVVVVLLVGVVCLQYHFASDKPPPPHLIAVSVCL